MRKANFIVGFTSWSKSTVISGLFERRNFRFGFTQALPTIATSTRFCVQTQLNDDIPQKFIEKIENRLVATNHLNPDLFATLYASKEKGNNCITILRNRVFSTFDEMNFFLLKYKWDHHAELMLDNIITDLSVFPNANFHTIDADFGLPVNLRTQVKVEQIRGILRTIY